MSITQYFKQVLPSPGGSLSAEIDPEAIQLINKEVAAVSSKSNKKRGPYNRYDEKTSADIGKYAHYHGVAAASRRYSRILKKNVSETTVRSIMVRYREELSRKRAQERHREEGVTILTIPRKKCGRPLLLGELLDSKVQLYLKKVREGGGSISSRIVMAAARGILLKYDRTKLAEFGGPVTINKDWAYAMLRRMNFVKRKATTALSKQSNADFENIKHSFLRDVMSIVSMEEVPPELILNWDQTGIKIIPTSSWTMDMKGSKRVEVVGTDDKRQITAVFCGSLTGDFLPVQLVYKGKTDRCHPCYTFPPEWHITHSPNHWSTEETMIQYIENIIIPYIQQVRERLCEEKPALVIIDNFKGQVTRAVNELMENNDIHVCLLPPNTTDRLQPMDLTVNKPAKEYMKNLFQQWYAQEITRQLDDGAETEDLQPVDLSLAVLKELGAKWLVQTVEYISDNPSFIVDGFIRAGITGALDELMETETEEPNGNEDSSSHSEYSEDADNCIVIS